MSDDTHETAPTQFVQVGDVRFAYRRFGRRGGVPLLFLNYFAANMDDWDPKVTNGFAAEHEVILFDNAGVGGSTGETPSTVAAMTNYCVDFCRALELKTLDIVGFSLGGMIAQQLAFEHADMVRRAILLGTGPRGGEGMTFTEPASPASATVRCCACPTTPLPRPSTNALSMPSPRELFSDQG